MRILVEPLVVVIAAGKRPASIPNLEAKPASADGTAPGRVWESRTPPQHSIQRVGPGTRSFQAPPAFVIPTGKQPVSLAHFSYEALDPVLRRVLSDERVLASPLPRMALESLIRVIR